MKKILALAVLLGLTFAVFGQDADEPGALKLAREKYQKDLKAAQDQVTKAYVVSLQDIYDRLKDKADKKPAMAVAAELEAMKATVGIAKDPIVGEWLWAGVSHLVFRADGKVVEADKIVATWKVVDKSKRIYRTDFENHDAHQLVMAKDGDTLAGKIVKGGNRDFTVTRVK